MREKTTGLGAVVAMLWLIGFTAQVESVNAGQLPAMPHLTALKSAKPPDGFRAVCNQYSWACSTNPIGRVSGDDKILSLASHVNSAVNRSVRSVSDRQLYGKEEKWTLPTTGKGDCEDFALQKKHDLIRAGVAESSLLLAQVFTAKLEPHVVLVVRSQSGDYILDNLNPSIRRWQQTGYTFVKMQNPEKKWAWDAILLGPHARR